MPRGRWLVSCAKEKIKVCTPEEGEHLPKPKPLPPTPLPPTP